MVFYHSPPRIPSLGGMVSYLRSKKIQIPKWEREGQGSTIYLKKLSKANKFIESLIDNKMLTFVDLCDFWDFLVIFWTYRGNIRDFGTYGHQYLYRKQQGNYQNKLISNKNDISLTLREGGEIIGGMRLSSYHRF